ncbi:hypothetical protein K443DRAFT_125792 [Laccaria amethystina LaAM-08-1]|uniref:Uncharacterized protein n=1 Tax=Laccaria amethystina LaAM-08-1 TaxID=1095629 RepID=A0A0C9WVQ4_9AGAR|nr:hypothetical protein K443DRAFT_125792 [Laccaria amethystina LaAM-08-1]
MAEARPIKAPATAESEGEHLFIWLDDHHHHHPHESGHQHHPHERFTFVGTYTLPASDERRLEAKGIITFGRQETFVSGGHGKFKVTKKKDEAEYDVEVVISYHKEAGPIIIESPAVFKGKGDLREGEGVGEWKWIKREEKK